MIQRGLPTGTPAWCSRCGRWQFTSEPQMVEILGAIHRHAACVRCGVGALCRDLWFVPLAAGCARNAHVEPLDKHWSPMPTTAVKRPER